MAVISGILISNLISYDGPVVGEIKSGFVPFKFVLIGVQRGNLCFQRSLSP